MHKIVGNYTFANRPNSLYLKQFNTNTLYHMYTLIAGTNRKGSQTYKVARQYLKLMQEAELPVKFLDLQAELTPEIFNEDMYEKSVGVIKRIQDEYLADAEKFVLVVPEYNGSMAGVFKLFIDTTDIPECWYGKKACLVGVAAGRAGNLRGMEHLTGILGHIHMNVFWNKIPMSKIDDRLNEDGEFVDEADLSLLRKQLKGFIEF